MTLNPTKAYLPVIRGTPSGCDVMTCSSVDILWCCTKGTRFYESTMLLSTSLHHVTTQKAVAVQGHSSLRHIPIGWRVYVLQSPASCRAGSSLLFFQRLL